MDCTYIWIKHGICKYWTMCMSHNTSCPAPEDVLPQKSHENSQGTCRSTFKEIAVDPQHRDFVRDSEMKTPFMRSMKRLSDLAKRLIFTCCYRVGKSNLCIDRRSLKLPSETFVWDFLNRAQMAVENSPNQIDIDFDSKVRGTEQFHTVVSIYCT